MPDPRARMAGAHGAEMGKSDFKEKWPYMLCWHERPADSLDTLKQKDDDDEGIL